MPLSQKSRSKASASVKLVRGTGAKRKFNAYSFALPKSAAKNFVVKTLPPGVRVTFVAKSLTAKKKLKAWASERMGQADRVVASERKLAKAKANIESSVYAPNSRARALLQGVNIAEADLKEAGGAFKPEEVQKLLNGVSRNHAGLARWSLSVRGQTCVLRKLNPGRIGDEVRRGLRVI
jgi:hypothetical protein